jgi:hypothetical protein
MFDNIENTQSSSNGGSYVKPGHYLARIDRVKAGISQQDGGEFVAIEMTILDALPDGDIPVDKDFNLLSADAWHRPGENVSHLLMAKHASFQANYKAFVGNVGGLPESTITKQHCEAVTEGLFEGLFVEVRARTVKTRRGNPFTVVGYSREVPPEEIAERVDVESLARVLGPGVIEQLVADYES